MKELRKLDVPYELAEILVRDYHIARLQGLYGGAVLLPGKTVITGSPELSEKDAAEQLATLVI